MGISDVQFVRALWEASPVLGIVFGFLLFILLLARLGFLNFRVTDSGYYDKVQEIRDLKEHNRDLTRRVSVVETQVAVLKALIEERQNRNG